MAANEDEFSEAIETFVRGFCVGRSLTHPYECECVGNLWLMRDAPRRNVRDYRKEEWVACGARPADIHEAARRESRGKYCVSALFPLGASQDEARVEFRHLGYRLTTTEPFFVHDLMRIPRRTADVKILQVRTDELAEAVAKATRSRRLPVQFLKDAAPIRQYVAMEGDTIVGRVRSVDAGRSTWCAEMHVLESHRRRGIGSALLAKMLRDDRSRAVKNSVLLSSHTGALLYPQLGYRQIGLLLMYVPKR